MDIEILYHDKFKFEQEEYLFKMYLNRIRKISNNLITKIKTEKVNDKSLIKKIKLKKGTEVIILLDEKGEVVTTDKFKHLLFETSLSKILFVIGGTDGFSKEINNLCNKRISLSKMTLTHSFAAIILLEQIYRSVTIKINHPYHRA